MPRHRRRKESAFEILLSAPWWASAIAAFAWFAFFTVALPVAGSANPILRGITSGLKPVGFYGGLGIALLSAILFFKQRASQTTPISWPRAEPIGPSVLAETSSLPTMSLQLLQVIDWKLLEEVVAACYRENGLEAKTQSHGPDGGVDVAVFHPGDKEPFALVQVKQWRKDVGVKEVRELMGVVASRNIQRGVFVSASDFTNDAKAFAEITPILQLVSGRELLESIHALPADAKQRLVAIATKGDYLTPTCASCGIKLVKRLGKDGMQFWGCKNYPKCKTTMNVT